MLEAQEASKYLPTAHESRMPANFADKLKTGARGGRHQIARLDDQYRNRAHQMSRAPSTATLAGLVLIAALASCTSSPSAGPRSTAASNTTAGSPSSSVTATRSTVAVTTRTATPVSSARKAVPTPSSTSPAPEAPPSTPPVASTGSAGGGDVGEIGPGVVLSMPSMVGRSVTDLRAVIGDYPVVYRNTAGAVITGTVPGTDLICAQKPTAGSDLVGPAANLTISSATDHW